MTDELALEFAKRRMCEQGYGDNYTIRVRHLMLQPIEVRELKAHNQFFIVLEPYCNIRIESLTGVFDLSEDMTNELMYEHQGDIVITNQSIFLNNARLLQVIPEDCKSYCGNDKSKTQCQ
jgi:hypothetical protein